MSFDLTRYREHKESGLVKIERRDGKTVAICKQYDRFTGNQMDDVVVEITITIKDQLMAIKNSNIKINEEIDAIASDIAEVESAGN